MTAEEPTFHLSGVIDPRERFVTSDHREQVSETGASVERRFRGVLPLLEDCVAHDEGVEVVDSTLERYKRHDASEPLLSLSLPILASRYPLLKNPIVEVADKDPDPTQGKLALTT